MTTDAATSETLISRIKGKQPLLEFVQKFRTMKPAGEKPGEFSGCCINPEHEDKNPSFYVSTVKNVFSCRGCGVNGNVVDAYALIHSVSKEDAKWELARKLGVLNERKSTKEESFLAHMGEKYQWQLVRKLDAVDYLTKERGLSDETIKKFGLGYCWGSEFKEPTESDISRGLETGVAKKTDGSKGQIYRSFLAGRITFPIRDRLGNVVAFAGRTYPKPGLPPSDAPKYLNTKEWAQFKKSEMFYGLSEATPGISRTRTVVVVEGYLDVAMLHQYGATNAVAAMGASASEHAFSQLWSIADRVIFCLDGDKAGHEGTIRSLNASAASLSDGKEVRIATLPDNTDPDQYVMEHGVEAFEQLCYVESQTLTQFLLSDLAKTFPMDSVESRAAFIATATKAADQFGRAPILREQLISCAKGLASVSLVRGLLREIQGSSKPELGSGMGTREEFEAAAYLIGKHLGKTESQLPTREKAIAKEEIEAVVQMEDLPNESEIVSSLEEACPVDATAEASGPVATSCSPITSKPTELNQETTPAAEGFRSKGLSLIQQARMNPRLRT